MVERKVGFVAELMAGLRVVPRAAQMAALTAEML